MRRFMFLLAAVATPATTFGAPVALAAAAETCVGASSATYRHTFNGGNGRATITAVRPLCPGQTQSFGLIAYTAGAPGGNAGQFTYSSDRASITSAARSVTLDVVVPPCFAQVVAVTGTELLEEVTSAANPYGSKTLGAPGSRSSGPQALYTGGSAECAPAPKVTFTNACDGSYTATLANGATANVNAAFLISGRLTRLAPGRSKTVRAPAGGTLTIRDNTFTTYVGSWRPPEAGCTTTPAQQPTAPAAALPTRAVTAAPEAPSAAAAPTATTTTDAGDAPAMFAPPTATATAEAATAARGMSTGSILATSMGLLLIGGGGFLLVRVLRTIREP
ncbi:hypothetical protein [Actinoplanes solisilvae]|uniref:hypothetical protein n=1 Tax=Actinoplanes solisilvae TaxID=2486853 RepID=UPI000FD93A3A|nr:hypothetical protein [Actinoplanes solisilvae]